MTRIEVMHGPAGDGRSTQVWLDGTDVDIASQPWDPEPKKQMATLGWWCWGGHFTRLWCHVAKSKWLREQISPQPIMSPLLSWMSVGVEPGMSIFTSCWMYSCLWGQASDFFQGHPVCFSTGNFHRLGSLNCQWYLHFSVKKPIVLLLVLDSMKGKQLF